MEFAIKKTTMPIMKKKKRDNERNKIVPLRKNQNACRKRKLQISRNIRKGHCQVNGEERKSKKGVPIKEVNFSKSNITAEISSKE